MRFILSIFSVILLATSFAVEAQAQEAFPNIGRIAVIDANGAERTSLVWRSYQSQSDVIRQTYQQQVKQLQDEFQERGQALEAEKAILTEDAFNEKRAAFAAEVQQAQRNSETYKQNLDAGFARARTVISNITKRALVKVAERLELDMIIANDQRTVILSKEQLNITSLVTEEMNNIADSIDLETMQVSLNGQPIEN